MQVALGVAGFFLFLLGSLVLAGLTGAMVAKVTRNVILWVPLALVANLLVQILYVSAVNLLRSLWFVEEGDASFWSRYWELVSKEWFDGVKYGLLFGVVAWFWSVKRMGLFVERHQPEAPENKNAGVE